MTAAPRRSHRALVVCALVVASQALIVSGPTPVANTTCESLLRWARKAYEQAPPSLDQLAQFDRRHRKAIFNAIPPTARAALWREQLTRFGAGADITAGQHAFIGEVIDATTAAIYEQNPATRSEHGKRYAARAAQLFNSRVQLSAFYDLGSPAVTRSAATLKDRLLRPFVAAAQLPYCECTGASPFPECSGACVGASCQIVINGCGWLGQYDCDGMCAY